MLVARVLDCPLFAPSLRDMGAASRRASLCALVGCLVLHIASSTPVTAQEDWNWPIVKSIRTAGYVIELKEIPTALWYLGRYVVRVSTPNYMEFRVDWALDLLTFPDEDITGDGWPDVVVEFHSRGAHCCYSYLVLSLGPELRFIPLPLMADPPASFVDLDGDGIYEVLGWDPIFHYLFCANPGTPWPLVILVYEPGRGYVPASPRFPEAYETRIQRHTLLAEQVKRGEIEQAHGQAKCAVLHLVLDYLYSGRTKEAWAALYEYYPYPDVLEFHQAITIRLSLSDLFVPSEP